MKKTLLLLLVLCLSVFSCSEDHCTQDCGLQEVLNETSTSKVESSKVLVCHNGKTLSISQSALQAHLDHGDTEGACETLSISNYNLGARKEWKIPCNYNAETINIDGIKYYIHYYN